MMFRSLLAAFTGTAFAGLSLCIWRLAYPDTDFAIFGLIPLALAVLVGMWPANTEPWRARLRLALREDSPLAALLTGRVRAAILSTVFALVSISLLAWQSLIASAPDFMILGIVFVLSGCVFSIVQDHLLKHFHQPFARSFSISLATSLVAVPATIFIAAYTWAEAEQPGAMLDASLQDAIQIGLSNLPERGGWIAVILSVPYGFEAAKLWGVVQLREYPAAGVLFSLDTALFVFILCRTAIIVTLFVEANVIKGHERIWR